MVHRVPGEKVVSALKYKTLKALAAAYASGKLDKKESPLVLDNDCAHVYVGDECVFRSDEPPEAEILDQALALLGIPSESA